MTTTRTADLTLTFSIERQDDEGWPWIATLESIAPRGTGLTPSPPPTTSLKKLELYHASPPQGRCSRCDQPAGKEPTGSRICDACAVEESISNVGAEEWLLQCDAPVIFDPMPDDSRFKRPAASELICDQEGTLEVDGYMAWYHYSGVDGEDWDEEFHILRTRFKPTGDSNGSK